jgi:hypothetical protein
MRKLNYNCRWNQLTRQQRETMDNWLFHDRLGYEETLARVKGQFGVKASRTSLCRYYQRRSHERQTTDLIEAQAMADTVAAPESDANAMRTAAVKLIAKTALKIAFESPDRLKDLESLTKLLLMNEDIEIRRSRVKLEQEQFHYKAASAASEELPKLAGLLLKIDEDDDLNNDAKMEKIHDLLFPDEAQLGLHKFAQPENEQAEDGPEEPEEAAEEDEPASSAAEPLPSSSQATSKDDPPSDPSDPSEPSVPSVPLVPCVPLVPSPEEDPATKELKHVLELAKKGHAYSAYCMGVRYRDGSGVPKDLAQAREWLGQAASQGIGSAKIELHALRMKYGDES